VGVLAYQQSLSTMGLAVVLGGVARLSATSLYTRSLIGSNDPATASVQSVELPGPSLKPSETLLVGWPTDLLVEIR